MKDRRTTLLWIKDLLDHMSHCHDQLHWAEDGPTSAFLTDAFLVDLSECRRLCEHLRNEPRHGHPARLLAATA